MAVELDASSTPTIVDEVPFKGRILSCVNGYEADASTAKEVGTAPGVGKSLYVLGFSVFSEVANVDPQLQDEDGNVIYGPIYSTTAGTTAFAIDFKRPRKLTSNKALDLKCAGAGLVSICVEYATAED